MEGAQRKIGSMRERWRSVRVCGVREQRDFALVGFCT